MDNIFLHLWPQSTCRRKMCFTPSKAFPFSSGLFVRNCVGHFRIGTFPELRGVNRELGDKRSGFGYDHDRELGRTMLGIWVSPNRDLGESRARFGTPRYSSGIANRVSRNSSGTESLAPRSKLWLQTSDPRSTVAGLPLLAIFTDYFTKTCSDSAEGFESRRPRLIREVYIADSNA